MESSKTWPVYIHIYYFCLFQEAAMPHLHTLSEIVDDQVESGLRDHINQRRQHLQRPLPTTKHHLQHTSERVRVWELVCKSLVYAHTYTLADRACEELTRLCRISSLANSKEQEEMSIRFFNSAWEGDNAHMKSTLSKPDSTVMEHGKKMIKPVNKHLLYQHKLDINSPNLDVILLFEFFIVYLLISS